MFSNKRLSILKDIFFKFQSCTKDNECCSEQLCVWGQCSLNATKGEAGSTCHQQTDCSPDLCCLVHKGAAQHTVQEPGCWNLVILYILSFCFLWVFSPALPRLLVQAHWARALLWCLQPSVGADVLGHEGPGAHETLPLCRRSPLWTPGVRTEHLESNEW